MRYGAGRIEPRAGIRSGENDEGARPIRPDPSILARRVERRYSVLPCSSVSVACAGGLPW